MILLVRIGQENARISIVTTTIAVAATSPANAMFDHIGLDAATGAGVDKVGIVTEGMPKAGGASIGNKEGPSVLAG
jgi:hypothetical protein